jgi:hypothetical protein
MRRSTFLAGMLAALTAVSGGLEAQAPTLEQLLLPMPVALRAQGGGYGRATPGVSAASPLGFGPAMGDFFVGAGYQTSTRYGGGSDGGVSAGFGLGDPVKAVGIGVTVTSLSTFRSGLFDRSVAAVQLHRRLPGNAAVAVGLEGIKLTGENFETTESVFAAVSKVAVLRGNGDAKTPFSTATLNVGLGNGRFCAEQEFRSGGRTTYGLADCTANLFASVGLRANEWAGLVADWTGQDLNLGVSLAPLPNFPLVITPALADVTGRAGDGIRFSIGGGFGLRF